MWWVEECDDMGYETRGGTIREEGGGVGHGRGRNKAQMREQKDTPSSSYLSHPQASRSCPSYPFPTLSPPPAQST